MKENLCNQKEKSKRQAVLIKNKLAICQRLKLNTESRFLYSFFCDDLPFEMEIETSESLTPIAIIDTYPNDHSDCKADLIDSIQ